jgi:hypothetical protein
MAPLILCKALGTTMLLLMLLLASRGADELQLLCIGLAFVHLKKDVAKTQSQRHQKAQQQ